MHTNKELGAVKSRTIFVVNPISGNGRKKRVISAIQKYYTAGPYEIVFSEHPGHAVEIARDVDASLVVAVGGDGTVSEVAMGIVESGNPSKALGVLPCGSGDGLALHLGMSRHPKKAVLSLNCAESILMDYATMSDGYDETTRMFFCTAGVGFDADVAEAFAKSGHRGLWSYIWNAIRLWNNYVPEEYTVTIDGIPIIGKAAMITVGNASQWGNNARIAPSASVCDSLLDVSFVEPFKLRRIPLLAARLLSGRLAGTRGLQMRRGMDITISRSQSGSAHYDGDSCLMGKEIHIKIHPAAIRLAVPEDKIGKI